jgi:hypothetical protein
MKELYTLHNTSQFWKRASTIELCHGAMEDEEKTEGGDGANGAEMKTG